MLNSRPLRIRTVWKIFSTSLRLLGCDMYTVVKQRNNRCMYVHLCVYTRTERSRRGRSHFLCICRSDNLQRFARVVCLFTLQLCDGRHTHDSRAVNRPLCCGPNHVTLCSLVSQPPVKCVSWRPVTANPVGPPPDGMVNTPEKTKRRLRRLSYNFQMHLCPK